jgi:hypothetical protein
VASPPERGAGTLLEEVKAFLREEGWIAAEAPDRPVLMATVTGDNGSWPFAVWIPAEDGPVVCYSSITEVGPDRRLEVGALLAELNFGIQVGSFEMDPDDGEVRFRTSVGMTGVKPTPQLLAQLVYANVAGADDHVALLRQVADGSMAADDALERAQHEP